MTSPIILLGRSLRRRGLQGRVALVTGGTAGIGRATVVRLARAGAQVVAVARDADELDALADRVPGVATVAADVADDQERRQLVEQVLARHGRVDVLVADVGIGWSGAAVDMTTDQVRSIIETNVVATIDLVLRVVRDQLGREDGDVVVVGSSASWFATPPLTVYSASKYALDGFVEGLRREVLARGVRVHTVHPGFVATEFAARSAGEVPGDVGGEPRPGPGMQPDRVARAVERALTGPGVRTAAVPRVLGLTHLARVPPFRQVADVVVSLAAPRLVRLGERMAAERAGSGAR